MKNTFDMDMKILVAVFFRLIPRQVIGGSDRDRIDDLFECGWSLLYRKLDASGGGNRILASRERLRGIIQRVISALALIPEAKYALTMSPEPRPGFLSCGDYACKKLLIFALKRPSPCARSLQRTY
jgi:hypothetical protein